MTESDEERYELIEFVYRYMRQESELCSGFWLEAEGYDIGFLNGYNDEAPLFYGSLKEVAEYIQKSRTETSAVLTTMRICGWIRRYGRGEYLLIREPNLREYREHLKRNRQFDVNSPSEQGVMYDALARIHNRIDEIEARLEALERGDNA